MSAKDLSVRTQLQLSLGSILLFVVGLSAVAWMQTSQLWRQTKGLYEHPLQVRRALGAVESHVLGMHRDILALCVTQSEQEREPILQELAVRHADVRRHLAVLYDRYLGPRSDVEQAAKALEHWAVIREETVRLLREGQTVETLRRAGADGVCGVQVGRIMAQIETMSEFARGRGDRFYHEAEARKNAFGRQLAGLCALITFLSLAVAVYLSRGIRTPLVSLTELTEQFRMGRLDVRSQYVASNEFGVLSASFNAMADAIQTEMQINEGAAQLAGVMLQEEEVHVFCRELLKSLLQHTQSQVGAVYFLNEAQTAYEHFESIGLGADRRSAFSAIALEGEMGAAVSARQIRRITEIPADTRFAFAAVSGTFLPREILTIPVLFDRGVSAVISLASVHAYSDQALRLVNEIWGVLTARVNGVLAFRKVNELAGQLERQNLELQEQKRELSAQAAELTSQNAELDMQKRQLGEASRLKSAFLSNMSHELRTPLNSVIALSGVLSRRLAQAIPQEEYGYLEVIARNGKNLLALINDILDLSRIEAGHTEISTSCFSVRDWVGEVIAMLDAQAREKGLLLTNLVSDGLPPLVSDRDKCRHILQNLVGNAVKFTEKGTVEVSAWQADGALYVAVRDTGIGIAADQLTTIFDEFSQADSGTARKYGGTGLGLAIAREHARLLGGSIRVESALGAGSTFTLLLPLAQESQQPAPAEDVSLAPSTGAAEPLRAPPGHGPRLLLVEDSAPAVIQLTDILQTAGYCVQVAGDGTEALAQIERAVPEAMILDLMMPEVDGFQVLKAIREEPRTAHLPVLILTAKHVTKEELSFLKSNHIHQLIQKGDIRKDGLLDAVARMVAPAKEAPACPPSCLKRPSRPLRAGGPVVLVAEDNPDNLLTLKALLGNRFRIVEAADGRAAVALAREHQPDLILMDIALPVMDGFAALEEIRRDVALRDIPVVAVTASAMKGSREEILARGFDGYVSKPIEPGLLLTTLRVWLDVGGEA